MKPKYRAYIYNYLVLVTSFRARTCVVVTGSWSQSIEFPPIQGMGVYIPTYLRCTKDFTKVHVLSDIIKWGKVYDQRVAHHQGAIKLFWFHFQEVFGWSVSFKIHPHYCQGIFKQGT